MVLDLRQRARRERRHAVDSSHSNYYVSKSHAQNCRIVSVFILYIPNRVPNTRIQPNEYSMTIFYDLLCALLLIGDPTLFLDCMRKQMRKKLIYTIRNILRRNSVLIHVIWKFRFEL